MTGGHIIYIPLIALAGLVLGFLLGRLSADRERAEAEGRLARREARVAGLREQLTETQTEETDG